jgi:hypothetical protein
MYTTCKWTNKLIRFDNNGGSARSYDMHVMNYDVESAPLIQFPLFVAMNEHTKLYTVCLKSKCTDFPMDELEM